MERLTSPVEEALHYSSPPISIEKFKEQCHKKIDPSDFAPISSGNYVFDDDSIKELTSLIGADVETIQDLKEVCSIANLECAYDKIFDYNKFKVYEDYPSDNQLRTIKSCKEKKTKNEEGFYIPSFVENLDEDFSVKTQNPDEDFSVNSKMIDEDEVIISCKVLHSVNQKKKILEVLLIGDVRLTELRDLIKCRSDGVVFGEFSNNPDSCVGEKAKDQFPSSFFFVERTFYNDTRNPLHRDYSKVITEWAKESDNYHLAGLGLLSSKTMAETKMCDLTIRLGYPYLFCHQGNCEHLVIFTDMRMQMGDDPKLRTSYPYLVNDESKRRKKCSICCIHLVKWVTTNDEMTFENPALFCDKCFRYLHYDENGKKLSSFQAYLYVEES